MSPFHILQTFNNHCCTARRRAIGTRVTSLIVYALRWHLYQCSSPVMLLRLVKDVVTDKEVPTVEPPYNMLVSSNIPKI